MKALPRQSQTIKVHEYFVFPTSIRIMEIEYVGRPIFLWNQKGWECISSFSSKYIIWVAFIQFFVSIPFLSFCFSSFTVIFFISRCLLGVLCLLIFFPIILLRLNIFVPKSCTWFYFCWEKFQTWWGNLFGTKAWSTMN